MADFEFRYAPLTGRLTGKQMIEQTEQAINGLANLVDDAAGQVTILSTLANEANENAATALEVANEALATTGRTYITVSIPANANDYYDSQLIYIADNTSTNIPVADTGMLEVKTNDDKTACEQVFIADSSGASYYRHGDITAETVGDVTTYTVTWGGWSSEPASQAYVQNELSGYLPLAGGTMTGNIGFSECNGFITSFDTGVYINGDNTSNRSRLILFTSANENGFTLQAGNGSVNKQLNGKPDGTLTWAGNNVLTDATVGTVVTKSISSAVNLAQATAKTITSISLSAGTWVVTGHAHWSSTTADKGYSIQITNTANSLQYAYDSAMVVHSANTGHLALQTCRIWNLTATTTIYLCGYTTVASSVADADIKAVRIV